MADNQEPTDLEKKRKQLTFRSWHRGTKEMDIIMGSFADKYLPSFSAEELDRYESILQHSDPDLYNWLSGKEQTPANLIDDVFEKLLNHDVSKRLDNI